jgi:O-antigen/teichoic acid export membrane protein
LARKSLPDVEVLDTPATGLLVIRGGALRGGAYLLAIGLSLVSVPLMTRYLGVVDYGRVVTVSALIAIAAALTDGGLVTVGVREYAVRSQSEHRGLLRALLGLRLVLSSVAVVGAVLFAVVVSYADIVVLGTLIGGLGILVTSVQKVTTIPFTASLRFGSVASLHLLEQVTLTSFVVLLVLVGAGLTPFFATYLVASLVALVATAYLAGWALPLPAVDLAAWRGLSHDMLPFGAAVAVSATGVVLTMTPVLATDAEVGYFGVAAQVVTVLLGVWTVMGASTLPVLAHAARHDRARFEYALQRTLHAALALGAGVSVLTLVGADLVVSVLAGPDFEPAIGALQILAPSLAAGYLVTVSSLALVSLRRPMSVLAVNAVGLAATIALALVLLPEHGASGGSVAVLVGQLLCMPAYALALRRNNLALAESWLPALSVLVAAAAATAAGMMAPVPTVAGIVIACGIYAGLLLLLRAVPRELLDMFRARP